MDRFALAVLCAVLLHAQETQRGTIYSAEKEAATGAQYAAEIRRQAETLSAPEVLSWVESIAARLAPGFGETAPARWNFDVLVQSERDNFGEPYALPGGFILVPTALLLKAEDEAEFAGMLAHAMAHVVARHGMREANGAGSNVASIPLIYMGGWTGNGAGSILLPQAFVKTAQKYEFEADKIAAEAMAQAGYDPVALSRYIAREQTQAITTAATALPPLAERFAALDGHKPAIKPQPPTGQFSAIQEIVRSAIPQTSRRSAPTLHKP